MIHSNCSETEEIYTIKLLQNNPDITFVFDDNLKRSGKDDQAIVRDEPNAFGIATKVNPNTFRDSFFRDTDESHAVAIVHDLHGLMKLRDEGKTILFPASGLGAGRAQMWKFAPKLLSNLMQILYDEFGVYEQFIDEEEIEWLL